MPACATTCVKRPEEKMGVPGTAVTCFYELCCVGDGNRTLVLYKNKGSSPSLLRQLFNPLPYAFELSLL